MGFWGGGQDHHGGVGMGDGPRGRVSQLIPDIDGVVRVLRIGGVVAPEKIIDLPAARGAVDGFVHVMGAKVDGVRPEV